LANNACGNQLEKWVTEFSLLSKINYVKVFSANENVRNGLNFEKHYT